MPKENSNLNPENNFFSQIRDLINARNLAISMIPIINLNDDNFSQYLLNEQVQNYMARVWTHNFFSDLINNTDPPKPVLVPFDARPISFAFPKPLNILNKTREDLDTINNRASLLAKIVSLEALQDPQLHIPQKLTLSKVQNQNLNLQKLNNWCYVDINTAIKGVVIRYTFIGNTKDIHQLGLKNVVIYTPPTIRKNLKSIY